jgi:V8-like Glu-specific endopeptidase
MWRFAGVVIPLFLTACNAWVRPTPPPAQRRSTTDREDASVRIESYCDPFGDGTMAKATYGVGVMVSDWQVLTAIHLVECPAIQSVRVTTNTGRFWRMSYQREWVNDLLPTRDGIIRLQLNSADTLSPNVPPPTLRPWPQTLSYDEPLWIQSYFGDGWTPEQSHAWASGHSYGSNNGPEIFFYEGKTEEGDSGSGVYDQDGNLVGIHLGRLGSQDIAYGALVTQEMLP